MKKITLFICILLCGYSYAQNEFITLWQTTTANETITIPTFSGESYNYTVDWGDGSTSVGETGDATHMYTTAGNHTVSITGVFPRIYFNDIGDKLKIIEINQWGNQSWTSMDGAFSGCSNLTYNASDNPDLSNVLSLSNMFASCSSFNGNIEGWNVSNVVDMSFMFFNATAFNQPLNQWDTGNVMNLNSMFKNASNFNQTLNLWDTSKVTDMRRVFENALLFDGDITQWDTSTVFTMLSMFKDCSSFNQPLNWDVSSVFNLNFMFSGASSFNADISGWITTSATSISGIFENATTFNQSIDSWDISGISNLNRVFNGASSFNQNLSNWDVTNISNMINLFSNTAMSTVNYDATLVAWNNLPSLQSGVTLGASGINFCNAEVERQNIITSYSWSIIDAGSDCLGVAQPFITTWQTTSEGESITIPTFSGETYNYNVDWGDGNTSTSQTSNSTHTYTNPGSYLVSISGDFPRIYFNFSGDRLKLIEINQWGNQSWSSMENAFKGCSNMTYSAVDAPDLSNSSNLKEAFSFCSSFNGDLSSWNTFTITNMQGLFQQCTNFNGNISTWNVSNVINMSFMLSGATNFNQVLNSWDTGKVVNLNSLFKNAINFNQPLNLWDTSKVTDMRRVFENADLFNQNISGWDTSTVFTMLGMFKDCDSFNQPLNWDVSKVLGMARMFEGTQSFNQDISSWDTGSATVMAYMFANTNAFNSSIEMWDTSSVQSMERMFLLSTVFNQNLANWDVSNVSDMIGMFDNSNLSTENYDLTLIGWNSLSSLQSGVSLGAIGINYCNSQAERQNIINTSNWVISDAGLDANCSTLGLDDNNLATTVKLYPNPVIDNFQILTTYKEGLDIQILDITGKVLREIAYIQNSTIDLSSLNSGVYFVKVSSGDYKLNKSFKIIKK